MGVLYTHSPKMLGPSPIFLITPKKKVKKIQKLQKRGRQGEACSLSNYGLQLDSHGRLATNGHPSALCGCPKLLPYKKIISSSYPGFFAHVVNSY
jgi:hypothetical protein